MSDAQAPWLIAVAAGRWQRTGISAARAAGMRVLALDGDPQAEARDVADRFAVADIRDGAEVISTVEKLGVVPGGAVSFVCEAGLVAAAALRAHYRLPGPTPEIIERLTDKGEQRRALARAGVDAVRFRVAADRREAVVFASEIGFPHVVKPVDSAGSRGVSVVTGRGDVDAAVEAAFQHSRVGRVILEEYIAGTEYTVESFGDGARTVALLVTEKSKVPGTAGTVALEISSCEDMDIRQRVCDVALRSMRALGYEDGPGHTEVICDGGGRARLVEAGGRGGGFLLFDHAVPEATGFDIVTATAIRRMGGRVPLPFDVASRKALVLRFLPSRPGTVTQVSGFDEANALDGVHAESFVRPGQRVEAVSGDQDRLAGILSVAPDVATARARADQAEQLIEIGVSSGAKTEEVSSWPND